MISKVALLPKQQRIAFELSRFEGFTHQQIADKMGVSPHTVKNHIAQALAYLRKSFRATKYEIPFLIIFFLFN
jgi:RNA polymerase sigma factor (sigma-70 family)